MGRVRQFLKKATFDNIQHHFSKLKYLKVILNIESTTQEKHHFYQSQKLSAMVLNVS